MLSNIVLALGFLLMIIAFTLPSLPLTVTSESVVLDCTADIYVSESTFENRDELQVVYSDDPDTPVVRSLLRFDLSSVADKTVTKALLNVSGSAWSSSLEGNVIVCKATSSNWTEDNAGWFNVENFDSTGEKQFYVSSTSNVYTVDVTEIIQNSISSGQVDFLLRETTEKYMAVSFVSREGSISKRPVLTITYSVTTEPPPEEPPGDDTTPPEEPPPDETPEEEPETPETVLPFNVLQLTLFAIGSMLCLYGGILRFKS